MELFRRRNTYSNTGRSRRANPNGGSPLDVIAILLGSTATTWFLYWLATALVGRPLSAPLPPELQKLVAFFGNWFTAGTAATTSLLIWFFRRTALPLSTYLIWIAGITIFSVITVLALTRLLPAPPRADFSAEDDAYRQGINRYQASDWSRAEYYFDQVKSEDNPLFGDALIRKGHSQFRQRDYLNAAITYRTAVDKSTNKDTRSDARYSLARTHVALGDYRLAAEEFEALRNEEERFRSAPKVLCNLASSYYEIGEYAKAEELLQRFPFDDEQQGDSNRDLWAVAYFVRAELKALHKPPDCQSISADVASAKEHVRNIMVRMYPSKTFLETCHFK